MTGAALDQVLLQGRDAIRIADYGTAWSHDDIAVRLAGMADYARCSSLLNKVRGALGQVLLAGGSDAVRARRPCDWTETCAAEVLFGARPRIRIGDHDSEIAKPYVLSAHTTGPDLVIRARVFGHARRWSNAVGLALTTALLGHVRWDRLARDLAPPAARKAVIADVRLESGLGLPASPDPGEAATASLTFATPISAERGDPGADPALLCAAMSRRLALIAPWHGLAADAIFPEMAACLSGLTVEAGARLARTTARLNQGGHRYRNRTVHPPTLRLRPIRADGLSLLQMAEASHVGRGATLGLGRFELALVI